MELLEQLELVDVVYKDKQVSLYFLDAARGEVREVKWNKQSYDNKTKKYFDNEEKAQQCEAWAQEYFGLTFDNLPQALGERRDVYVYKTYNSLFESKNNEKLPKFDMDMVGQIMQVQVDAVDDTGKEIIIKFTYEGETYGSFMRYSKFINSMNQYVVNPTERDKQYARFEDKFGIPMENKDELVGQTVMIEIKKIRDNTFVEIKPFPKKKK